MDSRHLSIRQLDMMIGVIGVQVAYLSRLLKRMTARGFPGEDRLQMRVDMAHNEMSDLLTHLHQLRAMVERQQWEKLPPRSSLG